VKTKQRFQEITCPSINTKFVSQFHFCFTIRDKINKEIVDNGDTLSKLPQINTTYACRYDI